MFRGTGKIYFIQSGRNGPIKIGYSKNPNSRLTALQSSSPYKLKLLYSGGWYSEGELHKRFTQNRINGEWYRPSPELLSLIKKLQEEEKENIKRLYEIIVYKKEDQYTVRIKALDRWCTITCDGKTIRAAYLKALKKLGKRIFS